MGEGGILIRGGNFVKVFVLNPCRDRIARGWGGVGDGWGVLNPKLGFVVCFLLILIKQMNGVPFATGAGPISLMSCTEARLSRPAS